MSKILTPIKAIRAKCLDCSADSEAATRECHITGCPLWPYRMGHRPEIEGRPKRVMSPEQKAKLAAALQKHRTKTTEEEW
jgi:hypothetical protein